MYELYRLRLAPYRWSERHPRYDVRDGTIRQIKIHLPLRWLPKSVSRDLPSLVPRQET